MPPAVSMTLRQLESSNRRVGALWDLRTFKACSR
jgi:hypothetical protein